MAGLLGTQLPITATPITEAAGAGTQSLDSDQRAVKIGDMVPIVFGKRVGDDGGVLVSPPATECRFEAYDELIDEVMRRHVRAYYELVVSEGQIDRIEVRDVFQQSCRVGASTTAYNTRSGNWEPGNFLPSDIDAPRFCGTGGTYRDLTTLSFINGIPADFDQWRKQVHCFVRGGINLQRLIDNQIGSSNNYADLALYLLRRSARLDDEAINFEAYLSAAQFLEANNFRCDCLIDQNQNMPRWLRDTAPLFLLRRTRINGKEALRPLLPTNPNGTINTDFIRWTHTFTNEQIAGFDLTYTALADRKPFAALMMWRQQPDNDIGLVRTTEVRYLNTADAGPFEQHDLSGYVTNEDHAVKVGAYILARRRYIEHSLVISLTPDTFDGSLVIGDIVRVNYTHLDSEGNTFTHDYLYELERISRSLTGAVELELTHFPIDSQGRSLIAFDVSRAKGSGILLPTGRQAVSCDFNDPGDFSFWPEFPTPDWDLNFDFDFDFGFDVPIGFDFDFDLGEWTTDASIDLDFNALFPDGIDINLALPNLQEWQNQAGDAPTVTIADLELRYNYNTFYRWQEADYVFAVGRVIVDQPPIGNFAVRIAFGDETFSIVIPSAKTSTGQILPGPYVNVFALRTSLLTPVFCENKQVSAIAWSGGGFAEVNLPEDQFLQVCPYVGTISANDIKIENAYEPEDENEVAPLVITGGFSVDNIPIGDTLEIALALGDPGFYWDIKSKSWIWNGSGTRPRNPTIYIIEIPGVRSRFVTASPTATRSIWDWDVFEKKWVYARVLKDWKWNDGWEYLGRSFADYEWNSETNDWEYTGEGSPPPVLLPRPPATTAPTISLPEPEETSFEIEVPDWYDANRDRLSVAYAAQGGFSSHVVPSLDESFTLGAFMIAINWAVVDGGGDVFQFKFEDVLLNGTYDSGIARGHVFAWDMTEDQVTNMKDAFASAGVFPFGGDIGAQVITQEQLTYGPTNFQTSEKPDPDKIYPLADGFDGFSSDPGELLFEWISVAGTVFTSDTWIISGFAIDSDRFVFFSNGRYVWLSNQGGISLIYFPERFRWPVLLEEQE